MSPVKGTTTDGLWGLSIPEDHQYQPQSPLESQAALEYTHLPCQVPGSCWVTAPQVPLKEYQTVGLTDDINSNAIHY